VEAERPPLVRELHRPIHVFFNHHLSDTQVVMHLIEPTRMRDGEVLPQISDRLDAQTLRQGLGYRLRPMQIGHLRWRHVKLPVIGYSSRNRFASSRVAIPPAKVPSVSSFLCN
jgi:hypothetical protein